MCCKESSKRDYCKEPGRLEGKPETWPGEGLGKGTSSNSILPGAVMTACFMIISCLKNSCLRD